MTFKGETYQGIIDIQMLLIVAQTQLQAYKAEQKVKRLRNDPDKHEIAIKINIQEKYINELEILLEDLLEKMDTLAEGMSDIECQIFVRKFITGKTTEEIMDELHISRTRFFFHIDSIKEKISNPIGNDILTTLKE